MKKCKLLSFQIYSQKNFRHLNNSLVKVLLLKAIFKSEKHIPHNPLKNLNESNGMRGRRARDHFLKFS